jgi:hypothetical protein
MINNHYHHHHHYSHLQSNLVKRDVKITAKQSRLEQNPA